MRSPQSKLATALCLVALGAGCSSPQSAKSGSDEEHAPATGSQKCPVNTVSGLTIDEEFGPGAGAATRCIENRKNVKVLVQVNRECRDAACTKPYALRKILKLIEDYEITSGLSPDDYEIVAVVFGGATPLVMNNDPSVEAPFHNRFQRDLEAVLAAGVTVYYCMGTARAKGVKFEHLVPGVQFVTSSPSAIVDLQRQGYIYVEP